MGLLGKIWVKLGLDNSELDKGFKDSEKSAGGFQNSLKKIGGMMAAAFSVTAVINFAKASVRAYNESAAAAAKLESVLKSTGGTVGLTSGELMSYAGQLQKITKFEDDATINAMALMATFKSVRGDIFKQAIASAQDLSTVLGSDLNGAVLQLGKALESPEIGMTMLRRSGISFTTSQIEQVKKLVTEGKKYEAQLIILKEVQSQFGGAAKAAAETAGGSYERMFNALGDTMEHIGSLIEGSTGLIKLMTIELEKTNTVLQSKVLTGWQKVAIFVSKLSPAGWITGNNQKLGKVATEAAAAAEAQMAENRKVVDAEMLGIKNIGDAKIQLFKASHALISEEDTYNKKALATYSTIDEMRAASLKSYISAKNGQLDVDEEAAALAKKEAEEKAKAKAAEEAAAKAEQMGIDGTIKRYQFYISQIDDKISKTNVANVAGLKGLNDEKAALESLIKTYQMTTDEAGAYYKQLVKIVLLQVNENQHKLTVPKGRASVDAKGAASIAPTDEQVYTNFYAWQIEQGDAAIAKLEEQKNQMVSIAEEMNRAMVYGISDGLQTLVDSLITTGEVDAGSVVAALISPFGDMLIRLGEMAISAGIGIAAIEESFETMNPYVALAAGAAMIALGSAIKAGVASIGKKGASSASGSASSFSGGNSYAGMSLASIPPIQVEIVGKLSGQDIVLAGDNFKKNRLR